MVIQEEYVIMWIWNLHIGDLVGDFEKKFPASAWKKLHTAQMTQKKNSCTAASKKKKILQSYFIGALQNPSKTATIQWLIFDETPFLHQDLF